MNTAAFEGEGKVPTTLFAESSPFFADIPLTKHDPVEAQRLFDELAAEGKPVEFKFTATSLVEIKAVAETLQAQLSAFDNVKVNVEVMDFTSVSARTTSRDFDMIVSSANVQDPDSTVWNAFHRDSRGNFSGINDAALSDALDAGRTSESQEDRKLAYDIVQQRISDLTPGIWYIQAAPSVVAGKDTFIPRMYAMDSPLPEEMWIAAE